MAARAGERVGEENGESVVRFFMKLMIYFCIAVISASKGKYA